MSPSLTAMQHGGSCTNLGIIAILHGCATMSCGTAAKFLGSTARSYGSTATFLGSTATFLGSAAGSCGIAATLLGSVAMFLGSSAMFLGLPATFRGWRGQRAFYEDIQLSPVAPNLIEASFAHTAAGMIVAILVSEDACARKTLLQMSPLGGRAGKRDAKFKKDDVREKYFSTKWIFRPKTDAKTLNIRHLSQSKIF